MNRRCFTLIGAILIILLFTPNAFSKIYKWVDKEGRIHITDYPDPNLAPEKKQPLKPIPLPIANQPEIKQETAPAQQPTKEILQPKPVETGKIQPKPSEPEVTPQKKTPLPEPQKIEPPQEIPPMEFPQMPEGQVPPGMPSALIGILAGFLIIILVIALALYIYYCLCLFLIAKKLDVPAPWVAWIPIAQTWTFVASARKSWWWAIVLLSPLGLSLISFVIQTPIIAIAGIILNLATIIITIYFFMCITENLGRNKWLGLLMLVPIVNLAFWGFLAFSKTKEAAPSFAPLEGGPAPFIEGPLPQTTEDTFMEGAPSEKKQEGEDIF